MIGSDSWGSDPQEGSGGDAWGPADAPLPARRYAEGFHLGEGGMGVVRSVEDTHLERVVARKVVQEPTPGAEARLLREARITAQLDHPGVVPVHDVGRTDDGRLYYTMRLVRGRTLSDALGVLPVRRALRHFLDVCHTVAYAHNVGIAHRDLKPSNILVGPFGETQVADWGLAIRLDDAEVEAGPIGTTAYMSPEVAAGSPFTPASDVWSLGAVLVEILTGAPPFGRGKEALARLRSGHLDVGLSPQPDPELGAIVACALQADASRRYASAAELGEDLEAWLDGRPVGVYSYSATELLRRAAWAWRGPLLAGAVIATVIAIAGATTAIRTAAERDRALDAERDAVAARALAERAEARALLGRSLDALRRDDRPDAERFAARSLMLEPSPMARGVLAAWHGVPRPYARSATSLECDHATLAGGELVCFREGAAHLGELSFPDAHAVTGLYDGSIAVLFDDDRVHRVSTDGRILAQTSIYRDSQLVTAPDAPVVIRTGQSRFEVLDLRSGTVVQERPCPSGIPQAGCLGPAGRLWAICSDGTVLEKASIWRVIGQVPPEEGLGAVITPVGDSVWVGTLHGTLFQIRDDAIASRLSLFDGAIAALHPSPDHSRVLVLRVGGDAALVGSKDLRLRTRLPGPVRDAHWSTDTELRTLGDRITDWDVPHDVHPVRFPGGEGVATVAIGASRVAVGRGDGSLEVLELGSGERVLAFDGYRGVLKHVLFEPGSDRVLFTGQDPAEVGVIGVEGTITTWPTRASARVLWLHDVVGWVPYGAGIRLGPIDGPHRELDKLRLMDVARESNGGSALLLERLGGVHRLSASGAMERIDEVVAGVSIAAAPNGLGWIVATEHAVHERPAGPVLRLGTDEVVDVAVSPAGTWLAVGLLDGRVRVFRRDTQEEVAVLRAHRERVSALAFRDEQLLITGSWDTTVRRWDLSVLEADPIELAREIDEAWGQPLMDSRPAEPRP